MFKSVLILCLLLVISNQAFSQDLAETNYPFECSIHESYVDFDSDQNDNRVDFEVEKTLNLTLQDLKSEDKFNLGRTKYGTKVEFQANKGDGIDSPSLTISITMYGSMIITSTGDIENTELTTSSDEYDIQVKCGYVGDEEI